ncbi:DUF4436 family protein [Mycolicibacterium grossiae]|nr:DUF4436 family protein [Mycolicibacterium grossiae]QEM44578.1 DUF4436 domain-containing protein [Mycolicibacterium grossiae]
MAPEASTAGRRRGTGPMARRLIVGVLVLALVMAGSVGGFLASREQTRQPSIVFDTGDVGDADGVTLTMYITRVDVGEQTMTVEIDDAAFDGALNGPGDTLGEDIVLQTNGRRNGTVRLAKGDVFQTVLQEFALNGAITDFPFDRYTAYTSVRVLRADGSQIPVAMNLQNVDAFFSAAPYYDAQQGWLNVDIAIDRSLPTQVFGVFIMVLMLGLALSAALLAFFVVRTRHGIAFGAYSVMAALLFAMVPLRNAIPGNPPIGSLIDFAAFFIAEAVISMSLIVSVVTGYRHQMRIDRST